MNNTRTTYQDLQERAARKGITTFGDICKTLDMDAYDIFGTQEAYEMLSEKLFNCDAAYGALESLAELGEI